MEGNTTLVEVMGDRLRLDEAAHAAEALGMTLGALCDLDVMTADGPTLASVCRALGVSADTLLGRAHAANA